MEKIISHQIDLRDHDWALKKIEEITKAEESFNVLIPLVKTMWLALKKLKEENGNAILKEVGEADLAIKSDVKAVEALEALERKNPWCQLETSYKYDQENEIGYYRVIVKEKRRNKTPEEKERIEAVIQSLSKIEAKSGFGALCFRAMESMFKGSLDRAQERVKENLRSNINGIIMDMEKIGASILIQQDLKEWVLKKSDITKVEQKPMKRL